MNPISRTLALAAAGLALGATHAAPLAAQGPKPQILILGSPHFGATDDYAGGSGIDILEAGRQEEVEEIVRLLAAFRPTKIAVEVPVAMDSAYRARYEAYRDGKTELRRSETEQIGFRLARRLGHPQVHAIDTKLDEDLRGVMQWAAANGDTAFLSGVQAFVAKIQAESAADAKRPLREVLRRANTAEYDSLHWGYLRMARVGTPADPIGASVVADRYERNLRIFANLARIAEPGDRVLVIYGASHGKLLRDFIRESGDYELVHPERYLAPPGA